MTTLACSILWLAAATTLPAAATCISPWQFRGGTTADDEIHAAIRDDDGNVYLGGFDNGLLGVLNDWPVGDVEGFVEKHAPDGRLVWRHAFDTPGVDIVEALAFDRVRHRVVVAGRTDGDIAGPNAGQLDLFIAALDIESGEVQTIGQFGDRYPQHPNRVAVLPSGRIVVAGWDDTFVEGNAVLGEATMFVAGFAEDPENRARLAQSWWRQPNEPGPLTRISFAFGVAAIGDGRDDVAVAISSTVDDVGSRLQRLDGDGVIVWDRQISPSPFNSISDVAASGGRLYAAGVAAGPLAGPAIGQFDGFLIEIDPATGDTRWGTQFGSPDVDEVGSLAIADDGDLFVAGWTVGTVVPGNPPADNSTYALSFSATGHPRAGWQQRASALHDFVDAISIVPACDGAALIAGEVAGEREGLPALGRNDALVLAAPLRTFDAIFAADFDVER
jgi:hypothetical protein